MSNTVIQLTTYFFAGLAIAAIATFNVKMIAKGRAVDAMIGSFASTFIGMAAVVNVSREMSGYGLYGILAYCVGVSIGTYFVVFEKKQEKV